MRHKRDVGGAKNTEKSEILNKSMRTMRDPVLLLFLWGPHRDVATVCLIENIREPKTAEKRRGEGLDARGRRLYKRKVARKLHKRYWFVNLVWVKIRKSIARIPSGYCVIFRGFRKIAKSDY